jgi:hypothetical protein
VSECKPLTPGRPRIVNLTSVAHEFGFIDFENLNSEGMFGRVKDTTRQVLDAHPRLLS